MIFHQSQNSLVVQNYNARFYKHIHWQPHFHQNFEVIYIFHGKVKAVISGKELLLQENDFALCLSNEVHQYEALDTSLAWVGVFSGDFVPVFQEAVSGKAGKRPLFRCDDCTLQYLKENLFTEQTPDFYRLTAGLNMLCGAYLSQVELTERTNREYALINSAADYIAQNFRRNLTLADAAQTLGYDYYYFSKNFHALFGVGFNDYLNTYRFNAAAQALLTSSDPITEIALDSGFQSVRAFNLVFQKKAGMSPSQYRKSARNQPPDILKNPEI